MPSSNTLVVYGHVGFDISSVAGNVSRTVGGAAYYAAMAAAHQGTKVSLVSILGADFPEATLQNKHLDTSASPRRAGPSSVFTQIYDDQNNVIAFDGKLNVCVNLVPELIPLKLASQGAILLATAPPTQQAQALEWLLEQEFSGLIAIDTTLAYISEFDALLQRYAPSIGVLFINAAEYEALSQHPPLCTRIIVKRGSEGASLLENGSWLHVPAPAAKRVLTTTGAGDVLAGAFLSGYLNEVSSNKALACAVTFATSYVEFGSQYFFKNPTGKGG